MGWLELTGLNSILLCTDNSCPGCCMEASVCVCHWALIGCFAVDGVFPPDCLGVPAVYVSRLLFRSRFACSCLPVRLIVCLSYSTSMMKIPVGGWFRENWQSLVTVGSGLFATFKGGTGMRRGIVPQCLCSCVVLKWSVLYFLEVCWRVHEFRWKFRWARKR